MFKNLLRGNKTPKKANKNVKLDTPEDQIIDLVETMKTLSDDKSKPKPKPKPKEEKNESPKLTEDELNKFFVQHVKKKVEEKPKLKLQIIKPKLEIKKMVFDIKIDTKPFDFFMKACQAQAQDGGNVPSIAHLPATRLLRTEQSTAGQQTTITIYPTDELMKIVSEMAG